jgi:hypothetical protein
MAATAGKALPSVPLPPLAPLAPADADAASAGARADGRGAEAFRPFCESARIAAAGRPP